jgi:hypothetical protein
MDTFKRKKEAIAAALRGDLESFEKLTFTQELPLFWDIDEDGNYSAGDFILTASEVEALRKRHPSIVIFGERKTY